jgi:hypothetical protein
MNNAKGLIVYKELEAELQQAFNASPYLLNKLLPKLKSKVFMARLNNANIPILWTNNNNAAYNNVIKQNQNWAVLKLPAFIVKLQELESDQTIDLRGSLHGQGSFELAAESKKLFVSHETWTHLTTEQRERRLNQHLIFKQRNNDDVTSLTVPLVTTVASKPGQRKRPLNAKTTTITTKKLKVTG